MKDNVMKMEGEIFWRNKNGLTTFLNILGSLHRNRRRMILFLFMVCFFFCLDDFYLNIYLFFKNPPGAETDS